jgi:hypothetical protein
MMTKTNNRRLQGICRLVLSIEQTNKHEMIISIVVAHISCTSLVRFRSMFIHMHVFILTDNNQQQRAVYDRLIQVLS